VAKSTARNIRDGLLTVLKADLPAILTALGREQVRTWQAGRREPRTTRECPAVYITLDSWSQPYTEGEVSIGGSTTQSVRSYTFSIWAYVKNADADELEDAVADYAEAIAAVCDDLGNATVNGTAEDMWPTDADLSPTWALDRDNSHLKAARVKVEVTKVRTIGTYSS